MRSELGRAADGSYKMDKIVWDSIDLLKSDGGLVDGVMAISESAKRYGERFGDDAQGLQAAVHKIFVKYEFASLGGSGELIPTDALASVATGTTKSKKVRWGCGVIAQNHHRAGTDSPLSALVVFALLLAPLGVGGAARLRCVATQLAVVRRKPKSYKN
jgi:hypothetical protein